jgi:hypothetical protein
MSGYLFEHDSRLTGGRVRIGMDSPDLADAALEAQAATAEPHMAPLAVAALLVGLSMGLVVGFALGLLVVLV